MLFFSTEKIFPFVAKLLSDVQVECWTDDIALSNPNGGKFIFTTGNFFKAFDAYVANKTVKFCEVQKDSTNHNFQLIRGEE